ncbi:MAG: homocysteine S-methyltransferase family protein [Deltaproteobacteria bacterium]|nr:homocysteine S-methyltransferase family protein [Deltaproteobacteria bacterium]
MNGFLVLDGPTGTELIARGYRPDPNLWTANAAFSAPKLLKKIHSDYLAAGANIITANTFRISSHAAAKAGMSAGEARRLAHASVALATEAIEDFDGEGPRFVAVGIGPLEDCYRPALVPELAVLERVHFETMGWLSETGCDLAIAETMGSAREALVVVRAARKAGLRGVAVSFIPDESGTRLLGGDGLLQTARLCVESGAETIMVNCVHADVIERSLATLSELNQNGIVLGAYANASRMKIGFDGTVEWIADERPVAVRAQEYAELAMNWAVKRNVRILGSCCGTSPEYIRELAARLKSRVVKK